MPYSNGLNRNIVQCLHDFGIPLYLSHTVVDIHGRRSGHRRHRRAGRRRSARPSRHRFDMACDCVLLSIGLIPENELGRAIGLQSRSGDRRRGGRPVPPDLGPRLFRRRQRAARPRSGRSRVAGIGDRRDDRRPCTPCGLLPAAADHRPVIAGHGSATLCRRLFSPPRRPASRSFLFRASRPMGASVLRLRRTATSSGTANFESSNRAR